MRGGFVLSMRNFLFQNDSFYHIYNRGVDKRDIFMDPKDYLRFLWNLKLMNNDTTKIERDYIIRQAMEPGPGSGYPEPGPYTDRGLSVLLKHVMDMPKLVEIICYCLIPNHFHLLLKQLVNNGISKFIHKIGLGYTNYFNAKYDRSGVLFQGKYKAIQIKTNERLLYLSGYINGNPEIHGISRAENWDWSSYKDYLGLRNGTLCSKNVILPQFSDSLDYKNYVKMVISDAKEKKEAIRDYLLE